VADTRKLAYPSREDEKWSIDVWFPRALEAGMTRLAVIMPEDALERVAVHGRVTEIAQNGVTTAYFDTVDEAREWLLSVK
jgi:hypothetical protein